MNRKDQTLYRKHVTLLNLNRKGNILLLFCFLFAGIIMSFGAIGNDISDKYTQILTVLTFWVSIASPITPLLASLTKHGAKKRKDAREKTKRKEEAESQGQRRIPRTAQLITLQETLKGNKRIIFLYGESGCGKTTLLREFRDKLRSEKRKYAHKKDKYNESWAEKFSKIDKSVVILDQFELALQNKSELSTFFLYCKEGGPSKIILSFKDEAYGSLVSILCACGISINAVLPMPLTYTEADQEDLRRKTLKAFQWNESYSREEITSRRGESETAALLADITERVYEERILLIEWSLIMDAIYRFTADRISDIYREEPDFHSFVSRLMLLTVSRFSYPEIVLPILYLLSRNLKEAYSITFNDFKLATLRREEAVELTVQELKEAGWVKPVLGNTETLKGGTEFEISHEYIGKIFASICNAQLDAEILKNLNNYEFSSYHGRRDASGNSGKRKLYDNYAKGRVSRRLGIIFHILLFFVVLSAILRRFPTLIKPEWTPDWDLFHTLPSWEHILVLFVCGCSTFYVYNFSYFVFCPYQYRAGMVEIFGSCMVILCLINPKNWPIYLAREIIMVGSILVSCFYKFWKKDISKILQTPGFYFILFGMFTLYLGRFFRDMDATLEPVAFLSFTLFILSAIKLHINYDFIYHILGKFES